MSITLETSIACAIEGTFGVRTCSMMVASMIASSAFIDIGTVISIPIVTRPTRAVIRSNLVGAQCILVAIIFVPRTLIYIYSKHITHTYFLFTRFFSEGSLFFYILSKV